MWAMGSCPGVVSDLRSDFDGGFSPKGVNGDSAQTKIKITMPAHHTKNFNIKVARRPKTT